MSMFRAFRYRLYPTAGQETALWRAIGATRFVYNLALEQRREWRRPGRRFTWQQQSKELTELRADVDWLRAAIRGPMEQALRDLDGAFRNFYAGRAKYPTVRTRGRNDSCRHRGRDVRVVTTSGRHSTVFVPGIGPTRFRDSRPMSGRCVSVTVSNKAAKWFVAFACEIEGNIAPSSALPPVGIDRGIVNAIALSTGELLSIPTSLVAIGKRCAKAQRVLSRRKRGSKRYARQRARIASLTARASRIRADFNHRASTSIARRFGSVAIEDLKTVNMTASAAGTVEAPGRNVAQKSGLNRAILNQGWAQFERFLDYKLSERGAVLCKVSPAYTSQTCSACGEIHRQSRKNQASFHCIACGHAEHADVNAAKNILRRSTAWLDVEGSTSGPHEASTQIAKVA